VKRLPLRIRLVAGFVGAMIIVLTAAGAFVFWRVEYALDQTLDQDLRSQTSDLRQAATRQPPAAALAPLRDRARESQLLTAGGAVLASGPGIVGGAPLLTAEQARRAARGELQTGHGYLFSKRGRHVRILALPVAGPGPAAVAASAVRLDQRDEALRELLAQLAIANLLALALASFVGYRLAHAALDPVERYRAQAEEIARRDRRAPRHPRRAARRDQPPGIDAQRDARCAGARRRAPAAVHRRRQPRAAHTPDHPLRRDRPRAPQAPQRRPA
jgi:hypothetical protein